MDKNLERIITEIEDLTVRMLAMPCCESREFRQCSASRRGLAALLTGRPDLDAIAAERIAAVIVASNGLLARTIAMRESVVAAIAETEKQLCLTRHMGGTVPSRARTHCLDIEV